MKKIIIASKNPVKIDASLTGFQKMFPQESFEIEAISAESGVPDQPRGEEIARGALNRVENALRQKPEADFWVGIEGGIRESGEEMEATAWVVIKQKAGKIGKAQTGSFILPEKVAELIRKGKELGEADDIVFGKVNSKQDIGAVGILTGNVFNRTEYYTKAIVLALIPFKNPGLY